MTKYHLNPKRMNKSVGLAYEENGARTNIVFDRKTPEHDLPEPAVKRLTEVFTGKDADLLPGPLNPEDVPKPAVPEKGARSRGR